MIGRLLQNMAAKVRRTFEVDFSTLHAVCFRDIYHFRPLVALRSKGWVPDHRLIRMVVFDSAQMIDRMVPTLRVSLY